MRFFHCPGHAARHHTLASPACRAWPGCTTSCWRSASLDDVGTALDIVNERRIPLAMSLGRHTNDLMTSFYVRTPSGFEIEYGTGGRRRRRRHVGGRHVRRAEPVGPQAPADGRCVPQILRPVRPPRVSATRA